MSSRGPGTPATRALDAAGVGWTPHAYDHDPSADDYGAEAARELGVDPRRIFKTLVADAEGRLVVGVVPVSAKLDLKALAAHVGAKRAAMAAPDLAERRTGYVVGGISPVGQRTRLPLVLDGSAVELPTIFVSGGRRGFDVELAPEDLLAVTGGSTATIATAR